MDERKVIAAILAAGLVIKQKTDVHDSAHAVRLSRATPNRWTKKVIAAILAAGLVIKQKTDVHDSAHAVRLYRECLDELQKK